MVLFSNRSGPILLIGLLLASSSADAYRPTYDPEAALRETYSEMKEEDERNLFRFQEELTFLRRKVSADHMGKRIEAQVCSWGPCARTSLYIVTIPLAILVLPLSLPIGAIWSINEASYMGPLTGACIGAFWPLLLDLKLKSFFLRFEQKSALKKLIGQTTKPKIATRNFLPTRNMQAQNISKARVEHNARGPGEQRDDFVISRPINDLDGDIKKERLRISSDGVLFLTRGNSLLLASARFVDVERGQRTMKVELHGDRGFHSPPIHDGDDERIYPSQTTLEARIKNIRVIELNKEKRALLLNLTSGIGTYVIGLTDYGPSFLVETPYGNLSAHARDFKQISPGHLRVTTKENCNEEYGGYVESDLELKYNEERAMFDIYIHKRRIIENGCSLVSAQYRQSQEPAMNMSY